MSPTLSLGERQVNRGRTGGESPSLTIGNPVVEAFLGVAIGEHLGPASLPRTVAIQLPADDVVGELEGEDLVEPGLMLGVRDRYHHFDPAVEVARHPVGRADQEQRLAFVAVLETDDTRVLEIATEDGTNSNVLA